jgi:hypothetical protein
MSKIRLLLACGVALAAVAPSGAATITVGSHVLAPNLPGQEIEISVTGGDAVWGANLFAQVGDGGPELAIYGLPAGTDGPAITGVDLIAGTIFSTASASQYYVDSIPQFVNYGVLASQSASAAGLLVTLTIDTSGFSTGTWNLLLSDVLPELGDYDTDFAPTPAVITNGSITIGSLGDANDDGVVNAVDASILGAHWLQASGATWRDGDFNADRQVNDADAAILAAHWGHVGEQQTTPAPEPAAAVLLASGILFALLRRR